MGNTIDRSLDSGAPNVTAGTPESALDLLWGQDELSGHGDAATAPRYLLLPSSADPRLILPTRPHQAAGVILNALRDRTSLAARLRTRAARVALAAGARGVRLPEPAILQYVLRHLPADEYVFGVHLGPPRANRKPVLALTTRGGRLTAFAKCGVDELSDRLVRREIEALAALGDLHSVRVPALIGSGMFAEHPYVVQAPVPTRGRSRTDDAAVVAAQVEVASVAGELVDAQEALATIADRWRSRASTPGASSVELDFSAVAGQWVQAAQQTEVPWGSWHGDWRRTNMASDADGCSVWDWERFATGVPAGYDALHLFLTSRVPLTRDLGSLAGDLYDNAPRLLRPFGVHHQQEVEVVTTGYLLELAGRYLDDDQMAAGARLGAVGEWLLPTLTSRTALQRSSANRREVSES
jgi:hypothetical protein